MKIRSTLVWTACLGMVFALAASGCCGPMGSGCNLRQTGYAASSKPTHQETAVAQRGDGEAAPAKTMSDWMSLQRSDLPKQP